MDNLKQALLALSSPPKIQLTLYPEFVCVGDELVLDFANAIDDFCWDKLTPPIRQNLIKLDSFIINHSGSDYQEHYTDNSVLATSNVWSQIRTLSLDAISSFGWEYTTPEKSKSVYVGGPDAT